jgi:hypothetical protein
MTRVPAGLSTVLLLTALGGGAAAGPRPSGPPEPPAKDARTTVEQKIDSQLLNALYVKRGEARKRGTPLETEIKADAQGRVLIDVRAEVTSDLLARVEKLGGTIVSKSKPYRSTLAKFPLEKLEDLARFKDVLFIEPAAQAITQ